MVSWQGHARKEGIRIRADRASSRPAQWSYIVDVQILLDGGLSVAARLILNLTMMTHNRHNLGFLSELERLLWSWLLVWRLQNLSTTHQWALQPGILMFDGLLSKLLRIVPYQTVGALLISAAAAASKVESSRSSLHPKMIYRKPMNTHENPRV